MLTEVGFVALALWSCTNRERIPALGVAAHQIRGEKVSSDGDLQGASYCSNVIPRANRVGGRDFGCTLCDLGSRASPCLVPQIAEIETEPRLVPSPSLDGFKVAYSAYNCAPTARLGPVYIRARFPVGVRIVASWFFPAACGPRKSTLNANGNGSISRAQNREPWGEKLGWVSNKLAGS